MQRKPKAWATAIAALAIASGAGVTVAARAAGAPPPPRAPATAQSRLAFAKALPPMDGSHLQAKLVDITYAPGESTPAHRHPCAVVGYVIEGALRIKVNDGPETIVKAGEGFYEAPNDLHAVSANASRTERARFLAYFTCDHEAPLLTPEKSSH
jgi:quercetin dioxygenase-like cupin family protein